MQQLEMSVPQTGTYPEGQSPLDSASRNQLLRIPVVRGSKETVRCPWQGCSSAVKRDNYARHVDETHLKKVKDVCTGCGRVFQRMYMKRKHNCHGPLSKHRGL